MRTGRPPRQPAASREWEEIGAFRETVLIHFRDAADVARRFGSSVSELGLAMGELRGGEIPTAVEARAAVADLRFLQSFLLHVGRKAAAGELDAAQRKLARLAGRLATRVGGIAATLEEAVGTADKP